MTVFGEDITLCYTIQYKNHKIKHNFFIVGKVSYRKLLQCQPRGYLRDEVNIKYIKEGVQRLWEQS
jgi:hypothetical protein